MVVSDPKTLRSLNAMLASASYSAEESGFGADALVRICRDPAPDLVLLELGSGNGRGLPMLRQLRAIRPDLAIVVLSASGNTRPVVEAIIEYQLPRTAIQDSPARYCASPGWRKHDQP
jgi:two-component system, NtrC family, response regulator AtoC